MAFNCISGTAHGEIEGAHTGATIAKITFRSRRAKGIRELIRGTMGCGPVAYMSESSFVTISAECNAQRPEENVRGNIAVHHDTAS